MACIGVLVSSTTRHYLEREGNFEAVPLGRLPRTFGRMAEWLKAAVLKTAELQCSEGSNPSSSLGMQSPCSPDENCSSAR